MADILDLLLIEASDLVARAHLIGQPAPDVVEMVALRRLAAVRIERIGDPLVESPISILTEKPELVTNDPPAQVRGGVPRLGKARWDGQPPVPELVGVIGALHLMIRKNTRGIARELVATLPGD